MASVGRMLRELRRRRGLTPQQMAIELAVYHFDWIEDLERGTAHLPSELYPRFADVLGLDLDTFSALLLHEGEDDDRVATGVEIEANLSGPCSPEELR
jgi:transcriptional regulator with XRE-family HTH domain